MMLQNRLALDMILLKESGVCEWLNASYPDETCCVSIRNAPVTLHQAMDEMRKVAEQARELRENMKQKPWEWTGWISKVFNGLGLNISGCIQSLIQYVLLFIVLVIVICVGLSCV